MIVTTDPWLTRDMLMSRIVVYAVMSSRLYTVMCMLACSAVHTQLVKGMLSCAAVYTSSKCMLACSAVHTHCLYSSVYCFTCSLLVYSVTSTIFPLSHQFLYYLSHIISLH